MKDQHDKNTLDLIPTPPKRGRPKTGRAMTAAEKQAAYRARKAANTVTVTFNREDINSLQLLINAGVDHIDLDVMGTDTLERIRAAIHRAKTHG